MREEFQERGFVLCPGVVSLVDRSRLLDLVASAQEASGDRGRGKAYAIRNLLAVRPQLSDLLGVAGLDGVVSLAFDGPFEPVDATFFDKNAETNWKVPAHQDLVVPVTATDGTSPMFQRYGATYTEPPPELLGQLVAARIHFDDCPAENGALYVVPGSHRQKLSDSAIAELDRSRFVPCAARAGDVMLMRPMLVHRSSPSQLPHHRRVLHVLYGPRKDASSGSAR